LKEDRHSESLLSNSHLSLSLTHSLPLLISSFNAVLAH
jgi:hypothetical protein